MGHFIEWDNAEKTVIFQQYTDAPIKDDLYHLATKSAAMLSSVPHTVYLIIDESTIKLNLNSADIKYLEKHVPANQGAVVVILDKSGLAYKKLILGVNQSLAPKAFGQTLFAGSVEEARQLLQEQYGVHYP